MSEQPVMNEEYIVGSMLIFFGFATLLSAYLIFVGLPYAFIYELFFGIGTALTGIFATIRSYI